MKSIQALEHLSFCFVSPLIVLEFILKQLIGFETMLEQIWHCSGVKWFGIRVEALLVSFFAEQTVCVGVCKVK